MKCQIDSWIFWFQTIINSAILTMKCLLLGIVSKPKGDCGLGTNLGLSTIILYKSVLFPSGK